ncbi:MAG: M13-type metalloendopeptidase [Lysobacterales bacterium]
MKYKLTITLAVLIGLYGCQQEADQAAETTQTESAFAPPSTEVASVKTELTSGIDQSDFSETVRPQDDFFDYVNGPWVENTEMPGDRARWGTFDALREQSDKDIRTLVEEVSVAEDVEDGSATQKIRDFYNSYMDVETTTRVGAEAIRAELDEIAAANSLDDIYRLFSTLGVYGVDSPMGGYIFSDEKDPNTNVVYIAQAGITMPDRDYYLKDDEQFVKGRQLYLDYVANVFTQAGIENGAEKAENLLALETRLAEVQWTKEENRNPVKTYNPKTLTELKEMAPKINWDITFEAAGIPARDRYIVSQPSFFAAADDIIADADLDLLKDYLTFQTLSSFSPVLGDDYFKLWFGFFREGLSGVSEPRPQWKRAVTSINGNMGELLGQLYVERHFQPEAKARMDTLIQNLIKAYEKSIIELDWMSEETKQQALVKLSKFTPKIGYTDDWRDYSKMDITAGDLVGNMKSAAEFEYNRNLNKLDSPVDKGEWFMNPQTVNAYYNPVWNEIVFPASILQPPFFNVEADDAVNYGGIGAVIGHEIGHGFDDQGRQYDGDGNLSDWWTEEDAEKFDVRKNALATQYDGYVVIDGLTINGQFTSGENIGDLGGLSIAYLAYKMSLGGKEAPVIDGLTGDQRFFLGWAQVWRSKARDAEAKRLLTIDPHSPPKFRANGAAVNVPAFYAAFDVKEGDGMYLAPEDRVKIW